MGLNPLKILDLVKVVWPIALEIVPMIEKLFGNSTGEEKRSVAVALIVPAVRAVEAAAGKDLVDEVALAESVGHVIDAVVSVLNLTGVFFKKGAAGA